MAPRNSDVNRPPRARPLYLPRLISILSLASKASHSSTAFEADDERSTTTTESDSMSTRDSIDEAASCEQLRNNYDGHNRSTTKKEIAGWYAYAFAAEPYMICAISSFIPILLESLARENGVLSADRTTPCGDSSEAPQGQDNQCIVSVLGLDINTASFTMYTFSISVLLQTILVVSISYAADQGTARKRLLMTLAWLGSASVMAYIFVSKEIYLMGAVLAIISNTSFGASFVLLNSFLPLLVRHHPRVKSSRLNATTDHTLDDEVYPRGRLGTGQLAGNYPTSRTYASNAGSEVHFLSKTPSHADITSVEMQVSSDISAKGIGIGYSAGLFVQILSIVMLVVMGSSIWSQRVVLLFIGSWWAIFTFPAAIWLKPRRGPTLSVDGQQGVWTWVFSAMHAWKNLYRTVKISRRLRDIMLFLGGWFLLSDAIATTSTTAILFAKTTLGMKPWALGMISVISTSAGIVGALGWSVISKRLKLKPPQTILACVFLFELIPIYGLLGALPVVKQWGVFGLQQPWEMYPLAAVYGLVLGGLGSYCRSLFSELIPPGSEAAFYALYAITDKGSSVFGPTIVGAIVDASGEIRPAFWFLLVLVGLPAPFIYFIDVERGKFEGEKLAKEITELESHEQVSDDDEEARQRMIPADQSIGDC